MKRDKNRLFVFLIYALLTTGIIIAYEPVRFNDFVDFDDDDYVTENPQVEAGITRQSLIWAFTTSHAFNWHPLTWLSHMLDCEFYGLKASGHHFTNVLFHVVNSLLLLSVLKRMTGSLYSSAFVAALFALHPLRVESVAWLAERKDVLSSFFWMLTVVAYIRYAERPSIRRYLPVVLAFGLGLMAKQMIVTLPFVLLLLDYWPLARFTLKGLRLHRSVPKISVASTSRCILEKLPLLVLSVITSIAVYRVQQGEGILRTWVDFPLNVRLANALVCYISYIWKIIFPTSLAALYPHPGNSLPLWKPIVCFVILAFVSLVVIQKVRKYPYLAVGWFWYLGTLVPVIGLIQVGDQAMADRYTYLPSVGIFIIVAWGAAELVAKWQYIKIPLAILVVIAVGVLTICTRMQVRYWKDGLTLYGRAVNVTKNNFIMHNHYGRCLLQKGNLEEALWHFNESLRINSAYLKPRKNIGKIYLAQGRYDEAVKHFNEVLIFRKDWFDLRYSLGLAYIHLGNYDQAIIHLTEAVELRPHSVLALNNLAWLWAAKKEAKYHDPEEAIRLAKQACELSNYKYPGILDTLAVAYAASGNFPEAVKTAEKAIELTETTGGEGLAKEIQKRLELYRANQPYYEK